MCRNDSGIGGACLGAGLVQGRTFPQGLKPCFFGGSYGTTKVVPFQNIDSRSVIQKAVRSCSFKTRSWKRLYSPVLAVERSSARMASVSMERQEPSSLKILSQCGRSSPDREVRA